MGSQSLQTVMTSMVKTNTRPEPNGSGHPPTRTRSASAADFSRSQGNWLNAFAPVFGHPTQYGPGPQVAGTLPYLAPYVASGAVNPGATVGTPFVFNGGFYDIDAYTQPSYEFNQAGGSIQYQHMFDAFRLESITAYRGAQKWQYGALSRSLRSSRAPAGTSTNGRAPKSCTSPRTPHRRSAGWEGCTFCVGARPIHPSISTAPASFLWANSVPGERDHKIGSSLRSDDASDRRCDERHARAALHHETRGITGDTTLMFIPALGIPNVVTGLTDAQSTFSKITWRFALDHRFNENVMTYISANRGFKSGVYNTIPPGGPTAKPVDPEVLDAYEIGAKTDWLDHKVRVNVAAFYYDYRDLQVTVFNTTSAVIENGARANVYGLDADIAAT